jgi:hypothetical protein
MPRPISSARQRATSELDLRGPLVLSKIFMILVLGQISHFSKNKHLEKKGWE